MYEMRQHINAQVSWIKQLAYENIPVEVLERTRWVLLDSVGCILNGMDGENLPGDKNEAILKCSSAMASTELYEGNRFAIGHPACHIVPILMVEAEQKNLLYKDMLKMFICAYEIASRWGSSVRFSNDILGHGTIMNSGAAVVEGLLAGLTEEEFVNYIMICEALPEVSTWQSVFEGSTLHDYYTGIAAVNVKNALYMANNNVKVSEKLIRSIYDKIEGTRIIEENLSSNMGDCWYILRNYFKVHSGCRFIHSFADVIEQMMKEGLTKEDVEEIYVSTYKKAARIANQHVTNTLAAKFSTPVSLAILLSEGRLYPDDIERAIKNPEVQKLALKIHLTEDEKYNALLSDVRGGKVRVLKKNGQIIEKEVFYAYGDFDAPDGYSEKELTDKFRKVTEKNISCKVQDEMIENILRGSEKMVVDDIFRPFFSKIR